LQLSVLKNLHITGVTTLTNSAMGYASETSTLLTCGGELVSENAKFRLRFYWFVVNNLQDSIKSVHCSKFVVHCKVKETHNLKINFLMQYISNLLILNG